MTPSEFYLILEEGLPSSTGKQRMAWADQIVEQDMEICEFVGLLEGKLKLAKRFLWLLSDVGIKGASKLRGALPCLFAACSDLPINYKASFASYWRLVGVPDEQEGVAIDLLMCLLRSHETDVYLKHRALVVMEKLLKQYPEIGHELRLCLTAPGGKQTKTYQARVSKTLALIP